ncbi:amidohydrolase [Glutamicibacter sp. MNS18]|uniref:amidohydrolase family protein n=1 Tax=Glutamicibacter sp. MNS18 TaxID=2989817 RepID=UPI0022366E14|nr:amidohydrolase family protein [Glutamicibacter sp. MNS18]MCW4466280.1 amidohydrolase [Glutamicibacter sp. MNS18]
MNVHPPIVDVHAHVLLPQLQALAHEHDPAGLAEHQRVEARRNGAQSQQNSGQMIRDRWALLTDLQSRMAQMDRSRVDVQIISPSPSHYYAFADPGLATTLYQEANRLVREYIDQAPERFHGLGLAPLQHPELLVVALEDAVLNRGLAGVEIGSFAPDPLGSTVELSDPRLEPFWERAAQLGAVVFLHPFGCPLETRLDRFYLANTVAQPAENAVALSHLIFAGVLDRFPELKLVAAHGGGYLPQVTGRSDHAWKVRPEARQCEHKPSTYLSRLWFDSLVHNPVELSRLIQTVGAGRIVLGSDYPFDMGSDAPVDDLEAAGLGAEEREAILRLNAADLGLTSLAQARERIGQRSGH